MTRMIENTAQLIAKLYQSQKAIDDWFQAQWQEKQSPLYNSVDLRHNEFKLAPIDVNLYPAGFNNLATVDEPCAVEQIRKMLKAKGDHIQRILIVTENHTRNLFYLESLVTLKKILHLAGFSVKLGMLSNVAQEAHTQSGQLIQFEAITKSDGYLHMDHFVPDCILLNNDLSEGFPELLEGIQQPILPSPHLGWYQRKKSYYFQQYAIIAERFAKAFDFDSWLINPLFESCENVNFTTTSDQTKLFEIAQTLLKKIEIKHQQYNFSHSPYLIVKADSGSYGMGVLAIESAKAITHLSRKHRQHMNKTKGNRPIHDVILQEGISTMTQCNQLPAEPVLYSFGEKVIGGFYRAHAKRNTKENLNTPGMQLIPLAIQGAHTSEQNKKLYAYQVISRLATLAAALEIEAIENTNTH